MRKKAVCFSSQSEDLHRIFTGDFPENRFGNLSFITQLDQETGQLGVGIGRFQADIHAETETVLEFVQERDGVIRITHEGIGAIWPDWTC